MGDKFVQVPGLTLYFGAYPDDTTRAQVLSKGVTVFVDLTNPSDGVPDYQLPTGVERWHYPTPDQRTLPDDVTIELVRRIGVALSQGRGIYCHCLGGHGRSAVVAACVFGFYDQSTR
jgi:protein-tyrosine phosphatase